MEGSLDRISELPEGIVHHVLSFLLTKYAIRAASTCKRLYQVWTTLPYFDLGLGFFPPVLLPPVLLSPEEEEEEEDEEEEADVSESDSDSDSDSESESEDKDIQIVGSELDSDSDVEDYEGNVIKRQKLFTFLEQTLSSRRMQDLVIYKFRLGMNQIDAEICRYLNQWINYLVYCNIKDLELKVYRVDWYDVPSILLTATSLHALSIRQCKIPCGSIINLPSLRKLHLNHVQLDAQTLDDIIKSCRNLEDLNIYLCPGLRKLEVSALSHLRVLNFSPHPTSDVDEGEVDEALVAAHSLEKLSCGGGALKLNLIINFAGFLKNLWLSGFKITNIWFCELISRLPCLEELRLQSLYLKSIEISSSSLKRLILHRVFHRSCSYVKSDDGIGEITVHAPNLAYLKYVGPFTYTFPSSLAIKEVVLAVDDINSMHRSEEKCSKLMQFLSVFDYSEAVKLECTFFEHMIIPVERRSDLLAPLAHIKHLILQGRFQAFPLCSMKKFVESLLWTSPNMVSLCLKERPLFGNNGGGFAIDLLMKVPGYDCSTITRVLRDCILNGEIELDCADAEVCNFLRSLFTSGVEF